MMRVAFSSNAGSVLCFHERVRWKVTFFSRRTETAPAGLLDARVERAPARLMGREHVTRGVHLLTPEGDGAADGPARPAGDPTDTQNPQI